MEELDIDGGIMQGNEGLRQSVRQFFYKLYRQEFSRRLKLDGINCRTLDEMSCVLLEREFTKQEDSRDLRTIIKIKPLDLPALIWILYKKIWHVIKEDI